jgi:hypothetical protein
MARSSVSCLASGVALHASAVVFDLSSLSIYVNRRYPDVCVNSLPESGGGSRCLGT